MLNHIWTTRMITSQKISKQHRKFHKNYILNRGHSTSYMLIFMPFGLVELWELIQHVKACKNTTKSSHNMYTNFNQMVNSDIKWEMSRTKAKWKLYMSGTTPPNFMFIGLGMRIWQHRKKCYTSKAQKMLSSKQKF